MPTRHVKIEDLAGEIQKDLRTVQLRVLGATWKTAKRGADICRAAAPKAFGGLGDSIHDIPLSTGAIIRADAPHAAAIENGSKPHMPPVAAIEKWVKLRGAQALEGSRLKSARAMGKALARAASGSVGRDNKGRFLRRATFSPIKAARQVAWAIAMNIKKKGTKAQPFMKKSLPFVVFVLEDEISAALERPL